MATAGVKVTVTDSKGKAHTFDMQEIKKDGLKKHRFDVAPNTSGVLGSIYIPKAASTKSAKK